MWTPLLCACALAVQGDAGRFAAAERAVDSAIEDGTIRGAVLVVGRGGETLHLSAHGERRPGVAMLSLIHI